MLKFLVEDCEDCFLFFLTGLSSFSFRFWMSFLAFQDVVLDFSTKNLSLQPLCGDSSEPFQGRQAASLPRRATHEFGGKAPRSAAADGAGRRRQHDGRPLLPRNTWNPRLGGCFSNDSIGKKKKKGISGRKNVSCHQVQKRIRSYI